MFELCWYFFSLESNIVSHFLSYDQAPQYSEIINTAFFSSAHALSEGLQMGSDLLKEELEQINEKFLKHLSGLQETVSNMQ